MSVLVGAAVTPCSLVGRTQKKTMLLLHGREAAVRMVGCCQSSVLASLWWLWKLWRVSIGYIRVLLPYVAGAMLSSDSRYHVVSSGVAELSELCI